MDDYFANHVIRLGQGEPMLLLHGIGHCKEGWDPVLPALAGGHDVAAIDLPGFGGAEELAVRPDDAALADWCERVMDEMGWDRAHLVGNSLGGLIALRLASRGRALSVTALSPGGQMVGWERTWATTLLKVVRRAAPWMARVPTVTDSALGRWLALSMVFGRPAAMTSGYARMSLGSLIRASSFETTLDAAEWQVELKPIDVPVTIAWGTRDVLLLPQQGVRWAHALPGSRLVKLPGLGHTPMPDDPAMVSEVIRRTAART